MNQSIEDASREQIRLEAQAAGLSFLGVKDGARWQALYDFVAIHDREQAARQSSQSEPVVIEAIAEVVIDTDGKRLNWLIEGGIDAMEAGDVLLASNAQIIKEDGIAEVYLAAPQQAIPSGWQPIETAPKDGTEIDVWCFDSENEGYRVANAWYCNALNKWRSYGDNELIWANMPSYWMLLPASPTAPIERDK